MNKIILINLLLFLFYSAGFSQFEETYLKVHKSDGIKSIKVWYFNNNTRVDFVKHQGYRYYTFGKHGELLGRSCYDKKNILVWEEKYNYDSLNRLSEEISYSRGMPKQTKEFTYDNNGESTNNGVSDGYANLSETVNLERDSDENIIKATSVSDGQVINVQKFEYIKYDEKNNWIKMILYDDDKPFRTCIRKIIYY
jgi:hypothetical protein